MGLLAAQTSLAQTASPPPHPDRIGISPTGDILLVDTSSTTSYAPPLVVRGILSSMEKAANCVLNPSVSITSVGAEQTVRNGNLTFSARSGRAAELVMGVQVGTDALARGLDVSSDAQNTGLVMLVLDRLTVTPALEVVSETGVGERLYEYQRAEDGISLVPRTNNGDVVICPDLENGVSARATAIVTDALSGPAAWVSYLDALPSTWSGLDARTADAKLRAAYQTVRGPERGISGSETIQVAAVSGAGAGTWKSSYAGGRDWDRCVAAPSPAASGTVLNCSRGVSIQVAERPDSAIDSALAGMRDMINIFNRHGPSLVRLRMISEPNDAAIFVGPVRQIPRTAALMDLPEGQMRSLRFEKMGYEACPYLKWRSSKIEGSRTSFEVSCTLRKVKQRRERPRR